MFEIIISAMNLLLEGIKSFFSLKGGFERVKKEKLARGMTSLYFTLGRILFNGRIIVSLLRSLRQSEANRDETYLLYWQLRYYLAAQQAELSKMGGLDLSRFARRAPDGKPPDFPLLTSYAELPIEDYSAIADCIELLSPDLRDRIWFILRLKMGFLQSLIRVSPDSGRIQLVIDTAFNIDDLDELDKILAQGKYQPALLDIMMQSFEKDASTERISEYLNYNPDAKNLHFLQFDNKDYVLKIKSIDTSVLDKQERLLDMLEDLKSEYRQLLLANFSIEELLA